MEVVITSSSSPDHLPYERKGEMTSEQMKDWIDNASYKELLRKWRFASTGDPFFMGGMGDYYSRKLDILRNLVGDEEHTKMSKDIGWKQNG